MAEVAKLMVLLHEEKTPKDLFKRPNSDLIRAGLEKFYSILAGGIGEIGDGKLGLETWNHLQIQAVVSVAKSIVSATRSLSVENAEPIMIAIFEKSLEFSTRCLEKLMAGNGDFSLQIFRGLAYIHTVPGVCHRDVKPQNLLHYIIRSKVKRTYCTYAFVTTGLQNSYLVRLNTQHPLISGQLAVFLLSCFLARHYFLEKVQLTS
ncbi:PREDICTED: uncharacterized protein LOC104599543 isoform X2 [Nelumbo nucifera]|uniref:Uncharacterized protein LOC104599543 isoform X2 n=1 Tax=Nelumbo nucifera TaxID=4432 RepID=A0A1U8ADX3_NELNU|nr:PREDICTED: uncharacterized protein LOC104599543 isoform X2 [Nelumbo nucifera]